MRQEVARRGRTSALLVFGIGALTGALALTLVPGPWGGGRAVAAGPFPDFAEVVAAADPWVAHVTTLLPSGGGAAGPGRAAGSRDDAVGAGFVVSADGLVVSSRHVVSGAQRVTVSLPGRPPLPASVVGMDEPTDLVLLRVPARGLATARIGDPGSLRVGEWVLAAGSPYHLARSWSVGIVSGLHRSQVGVSLRGFEDFIQTDAAANVGNSGGPLVDSAGRVVGMVSAILSRTGVHQGVSLAVPVDAVMAAVRRILGQPAAPEGPAASLGIYVRETDTRGGGGAGLTVTRFEPGSPSEAAGLLPGDVLVSVDDTQVVRTADLQRALWSKRPGDSVRVTFLRSGRTLVATVRLR
jgi:S1-C subfamily serine protease